MIEEIKLWGLACKDLLIVQSSAVQALLAVIIIKKQGYISYFSEVMLRILISNAKKTVWYHPLSSMICLNPLTTQD